MEEDEEEDNVPGWVGTWELFGEERGGVREAFVPIKVLACHVAASYSNPDDEDDAASLRGSIKARYSMSEREKKKRVFFMCP